MLKISKKAALNSVLIKDMLEDLAGHDCDEEDEDDAPIPLMTLDFPTLEHVAQWLEHHKNDPEYIQEDEEDNSTKSIEIPDQWDKNFLNKFNSDHEALFQMFVA